MKLNATLDRGLEILELFLDSDETLTIPDMSERVGIPQSSVYRMVRSLRERGWLGLEQPGSYRLGNRLLTAISRAESQSTLVRAARPALEALTLQSRETTLLTIINGRQVLCLLRVEGLQAVRVSFQPGAILPLHAGASSTALLAYAAKPLIEEVLQGELMRYSAATVVDPQRLRAKLEEIRRRGYAYSQGEVDAGVAAIAAPVLMPERPAPLAAISVVAPSQRLGRSEIPETAAMVIEAAEQLAAEVAQS